MRTPRPVYISLIFIILLFCFTIFAGKNLQEQRTHLPKEYYHAKALMISPVALKIFSGEFNGIFSDYLLLQASYFVGGLYKPEVEDWQTVAILYEQSIALDPYFFSALFYAEGTLAWIDSLTTRVNTMLKKGHSKRYWDWQPGFYLAFNLYHLLDQSKLASQYFKEVSERPGAPPLAAYLAAKTSQQNGNTLLSIKLLQTMLGTYKGTEQEGEIKKRLLGYQNLFVIEKAINRFESEFRVLPQKLEELCIKGYLKKLPKNPYGKEFIYKPDTGYLFFFPDYKKK